jgi:hypothetical protein
MTGRVTWQPKLAALRDLFLLVLYRSEGHIIEDESGKVASILRERAGIPDTKLNGSHASHVLKLMKDSGLIKREMIAGGKGTRKVTLDQFLPPSMITTLVAGEKANRLFFTHGEVEAVPEVPSERVAAVTVVTPDDRYGQLFADVSKSLAAIRTAAATTERRTNHGLVIINVADILRSVGIKGRRAEEIRYYLKMLGLVKAVRQSDEKVGRFYLSWWEVSSDKPLDPRRLREWASGEHSFENYKAHNGRRDPLEDGSRERKFAGRVPAVLPDALVGPLIIRRVEAVTPRPEPVVVAVEATLVEEVAAVPAPAAAEVTVSSGDRVADLLEIIERLEHEKTDLEQALSQAAERHEAEMEILREQVQALTQQVQAYAASAERADAVIARYRSK